MRTFAVERTHNAVCFPSGVPAGNKLRVLGTDEASAPPKKPILSRRWSDFGSSSGEVGSVDSVEKAASASAGNTGTGGRRGKSVAATVTMTL